MTAERNLGPSILDNPIGFIDRIAELQGKELSEQEASEVRQWVLGEYQEMGGLISQQNFSLVRRPNGRPRGYFRSIRYSDDVHLSEPHLGESYGRSEINLSIDRGGLRISPEAKGEHMGRASFRAGAEDRAALTRVYLEDYFIDVDDQGEAVVKHRKFVLAFQPTFNIKRMGEFDSF